jgi:hypothetical protein
VCPRAHVYADACFRELSPPDRRSRGLNDWHKARTYTWYSHLTDQLIYPVLALLRKACPSSVRRNARNKFSSTECQIEHFRAKSTCRIVYRRRFALVAGRSRERVSAVFARARDEFASSWDARARARARVCTCRKIFSTRKEKEFRGECREISVRETRLDTYNE